MRSVPARRQAPGDLPADVVQIYVFWKGASATRDFAGTPKWPTHWQVAIVPTTYRFIWRLRTEVGDVCPLVDDQGDLSG